MSRKVPPLVILKCKDKEIEKKYGLWVFYRTKSWVIQCLLKWWLQLVLPSLFDIARKLLVWDSCRANNVKDIKNFMKTKGIVSVMIPGSLTAYVQAATFLFTNLSRIWSLHWLVSGNHQGDFNLLLEEIQNHQMMKQCVLGWKFSAAC